MAVEVMKVYPDHPHQRVIKKAVKIIKSGGLVVYPTDTIYGLGGDLYNKSAIE
ncbi:MAG TPA: threonylcarbamoyl-AMP synthase, partial [Caldithrix abyssi]|nr:threonylcarbamoyl-AMP synthase [Caldithrix abyssi]